MGTAQKGLLALGVLLVIVLLTAGNCGPDEDAADDRPTMTESTEGAADSRMRTGTGGGTQPGAAKQRDAGSYGLRVRVLNEAGVPLVGARVVMILAARPADGPVAVASAGDGGRAQLEGLAAGEYLLNVSAAGFLSTGPVPIRMPDEAGSEVIAQLRSAGRIDGALYGLDGQARTDGVLRLRLSSGDGRTFHTRPDERGSFASGPLEPGVWELAWLPAEGEPADPRLVYARAVSAGEQVRVELTVPLGGDAPVAGRRVGVVEMPR